MVFPWLFLCYLLFVAVAYGKKVDLNTGATEPAAPTYQVVLITGCSSGIGKATAMKFASSGDFRVYATMRSPERFRWTSDTLLTAEEATKDPALGSAETEFRVAHPHLHIARMDVTDESSVEHAVRSIVEVEGRVDVLVNNAGVGLAGCIEAVEIAQAKALFDVNVWGPVRVMQAVLPYMRAQGAPTFEEAQKELATEAAVAAASGEDSPSARRRRGFFRKGGYIINLSSTSGIRGVPGYEVYTGSKFALEGIADSMRYSLAAFGISITNVNAGPVLTPFVDKVLAGADGDSSLDLGSGVGKRSFSDNTGYLQYLTERMTELLRTRVKGGDAQASAEVAQVVHNLVTLRNSPHAHSVADVPFNIGSDYRSQGVIDAVRKHPTGWTGAYLQVLDSLPNVFSVIARRGKDQGHQEL